jgi:threonine/homoserine efflux transporter RhtA
VPHPSPRLFDFRFSIFNWQLAIFNEPAGAKKDFPCVAVPATVKLRIVVSGTAILAVNHGLEARATAQRRRLIVPARI